MSTTAAERRFRPWVGRWYGRGPTRLLVVGESHYGRDDQDHPDLTGAVVDEWRRGDARLRYFTKLGRLLTGMTAPELNRAEALNGIAFYNYIQRLLRVDNKEQPGGADWAAAQTAFLTTVAELDPTHILVTGLRVYRHMPPPKGEQEEVFAGKVRSVCDYPANSGVARTIAIPHLSRANVADWAPVVNAFLVGGQQARAAP